MYVPKKLSHKVFARFGLFLLHRIYPTNQQKHHRPLALARSSCAAFSAGIFAQAVVRLQIHCTMDLQETMRSMGFNRQYDEYARLLQCTILGQYEEFTSEYEREELTELADSVRYYMERQRPNMYFYVVINERLGFVRVGAHEHPTAMCLQMQAGMNFEVDLVATFPIKPESAERMETLFRERNESTHTNNNWYSMGTDNAIREVATVLSS